MSVFKTESEVYKGNVSYRSMKGVDMAQGLYLEEFEIGKEFISQGRTITEADVVNFAGISGDFNPLHMDEEFGRKGVFGKRIAHGALGFSISTGLSNQMGLFFGTTIAFIECTVKYTSPLLIGDTVHITIVPTSIKPSSKPGKGTLKQNLKLINQDGKTIMESSQVLLMKTKAERIPGI